MSEREPTAVRCEKCGREWNTRAKKKAICTNPNCKSTKIINLHTGEKYNLIDPFISAQKKATAKRMKIPLEQVIAEEQETILGEDPQEKKIYRELFEEDGQTPKIDSATSMDVQDIFRHLPKPSAYLVAAVQNLSIIPARFLGMQWIMADEEAEFIAAACVPLINELGINASKLPPQIMLVAALGVYTLPRLLVTLFSPKKEEDQNNRTTVTQKTRYTESAPPPSSQTPITSRERVEAEAEEFKRRYAASLDEHGNDLYKSRRQIRKPGQ